MKRSRPIPRAAWSVTTVIGLLLCGQLPVAGKDPGTQPSKRELSFAATDGLKVTADFYPSRRKLSRGMILLCHRAGWSRGEYKRIGPWLRDQGFGVIAIDQRSGGGVDGVVNETAKRARKKGLATDYLSAKPDIEGAIKFISEKFQVRRLILLGSSYSASLVLAITGEGKWPIAGVVAFSPGEYFDDRRYVGKRARKIKVPTFVTSKRSEVKQHQRITKLIDDKVLTVFVPSSEGYHGARAVWHKTAATTHYRRALSDFLNKHW
jgi:alpha-beta hydrolase superfamily lysophospholipase